MATKTCDLSWQKKSSKIADELAGGGYSREQLVDMLNQEGVQTSEALLNAYNSSDVMQRAVELGKQGRAGRLNLKQKILLVKVNLGAYPN